MGVLVEFENIHYFFAIAPITESMSAVFAGPILQQHPTLTAQNDEHLLNLGIFANTSEAYLKIWSWKVYGYRTT